MTLEATLEDSRQQVDPLPLQFIDFPAAVTGQFIKFELLEWYGNGGGLQFFDIQDRASAIQQTNKQRGN